MQDLKGRTVLITGGTSGIGAATALAAADAGANVVITGRRTAEGENIAEQARSRGVKAQFVQGDVSDEAAIERAVEQAVRLGGRLDMAFNNAGVELGGINTADSSAADYRRVFDVNVLGVLLSMKHEILAMIASGAAGKGASIVNNASIAGSIGLPGAAIYVASKHAVLGLTRSAALEVARDGIRINAVSPAAIETPMFDRFTGNRNPDMVGHMTSLHPIGRLGRPPEIASAVLFLFSGASSFMTGHDLKVDGGFSVP